DPTEQARFGRIGKQRIEDTGALTKKRMETIDDETSAAAMDFMARQVKAAKPFFCWMNSTRMHLRTHVRAEHRDQPGLTARTEYADGMIEHDAMVGTLLKQLDDLKIAANTIVIYSADNGPHANPWPGHIKAGEVSNEIISALDWSPTLLAAAGVPDIAGRLLKGHSAAGKTFKVHQDGYNLLPYLTGQEPKSARREFLYFNDDGDIVGVRYEN